MRDLFLPPLPLLCFLLILPFTFSSFKDKAYACISSNVKNGIIWYTERERIELSRSPGTSNWRTRKRWISGGFGGRRGCTHVSRCVNGARIANLTCETTDSWEGNINFIASYWFAKVRLFRWICAQTRSEIPRVSIIAQFKIKREREIEIRPISSILRIANRGSIAITVFHRCSVTLAYINSSGFFCLI